MSRLLRSRFLLHLKNTFWPEAFPSVLLKAGRASTLFSAYFLLRIIAVIVMVTDPLRFKLEIEI